MVRRRRGCRAVPALATLAVAVGLGACSSTPSPSASSTSTSPERPTTSTAASPAATTSSTNVAPTTTPTLVPETPTGTEFYAPSGNLQCELDLQLGPSAVTQAMCLTVNPPQSATLGADSSLNECAGPGCLSNAGVNTPRLPYGTSISVGPFTCLSMTTGMRCTLENGDGFVLARSGVTPLGNVTVTTTTSG